MSEHDRSLRFAGPFSAGPDDHRTWVQRPAAFVWLLFILFPLINALGKHQPAFRHVLTVVGAVAFIVAYIALVVLWRRRRHSLVPAALFALLLALATALTLSDRTGWGFLFTYCAACAALIAPARLAFAGVAGCVALAGVTSAISHTSGANVVSILATSAGIGLLMLLMRDLRTRNEELSEARAELARLAVAEERERFARDLHDLLGHSLSMIALKAELARRLVRERPAEAKHEIAEVERAARDALGEVREAVSGYRQPTLDGELAGARMALSAAGIEVDVRREEVKLDPALDAVLAWAVREGATNVIRHSRARRVVMRIGSGLTEAFAQISDDGGGGNVNGRGNGLTGLAERARSVGGTATAAPLERGGFRLEVRVPVGGA